MQCSVYSHHLFGIVIEKGHDHFNAYSLFKGTGSPKKCLCYLKGLDH